MKITINVTPTEHELLQNLTQKSGHKDVESFIKSKIFKSSDIIRAIWREAIIRSQNMADGETFIVKNLFKEEEWNLLSFGQRKALGKLFYAENLNHGLTTVGKNSSGQQQYRKV